MRTRLLIWMSGSFVLPSPPQWCTLAYRPFRRVWTKTMEPWSPLAFFLWELAQFVTRIDLFFFFLLRVNEDLRYYFHELGCWTGTRETLVFGFCFPRLFGDFIFFFSVFITWSIKVVLEWGPQIWVLTWGKSISGSASRFHKDV